MDDPRRPASLASPLTDERPAEVAPGWLSPSRLFYGWWIVIASAGLQMLNGALLGQAFGAYVVVLRAEFGWSATSLAAASSLREMESGIVGPVQGWLLHRFGPRLIAQVGLVIFAGGFILFSRMQTLTEFYTAFLVMAVGASMSGYLTVTYVAVQWFEKKRATALGLMATGGAVGGLLVRVTVASMETFGWRETGVLSAIILLALGLPLTMILRFRPADSGMYPDGVPPVEEPRNADGSALAGQTRDFTLGEAIRTRAFWLVGFGHASALFVVSALNVHFISHLNHGMGYSLGFATSISLLLPLMFLIGTVAGGPLGDRFDKRWVMVVCMLMHGTAILLLAFAWNLVMVIIFCVMHGLAWGVRGPQMAAIRADYFGRTSFATILGVSNAIIIIGTISGPVIAGYVYDVTGSYRIGFEILSAFAILGSGFFILGRAPQRPLASS
jgi:MFS family permease